MVENRKSAAVIDIINLVSIGISRCLNMAVMIKISARLEMTKMANDTHITDCCTGLKGIVDTLAGKSLMSIAIEYPI